MPPEGGVRGSEPQVTEDVQWIEATLSGDRGAFGRLVQKYQDRLYSAMVQVTQSRTEAEDLVQDAFVQAFVKLNSFQGASAFYTWLYRIAMNLAFSRRRRRRTHLSVEQSRELAGSEPVAPDPPASASLEREEGAQAVHAALAKLSDEHRAILVLREMEGCDYETIAAMLDLPVGTVRSRLHRARSQLREILSGEQRDDPT